MIVAMWRKKRRMFGGKVAFYFNTALERVTMEWATLLGGVDGGEGVIGITEVMAIGTGVTGVIGGKGVFTL